MKDFFLVIILICIGDLMYSQSDELLLSVQEEEQSEKVEITLDIVYPYLWRGMRYYGNKIAFQPTLSYSITNKLTIGVWASTNLSNDADAYNEFDWSINYQLSPTVAILLEDYYWPATKNNTDWSRSNYFNYSEGSSQTLDLSIIADFSENGIPIDFQWSTFIGGNDYKYDLNQNSKRAFSSYAEMGYTFAIEKSGFDFRPFIGAVIINGGYYGTDSDGNAGFTWSNIGVNISKEIKVSKSFSVPIYIQYTNNEYGIPQYDKEEQLTKTIHNFISGGITLNLK